MYKWYTKQGQIKDPLYEIIYSVVYDAKKVAKNDRGNLEPFIKRNIIYVGESPVQDSLFPNGLYLAYDDNISQNKWLYFIYPTHANCDVIFADHMTFVYDKSDKKKPCHFHNTVYKYINVLGKWNYIFNHVKDYIPDKLNLVTDENTIFKNHANIKHVLMNIINYPAKVTGGSGNKKTKQKMIARPIQNNLFCSLWDEYKIKNITAFGFKLNDEIVFSVKIITKGKIVNSRLYNTVIFKTKSFDNYEFELQEYLATHIPGLGI